MADEVKVERVKLQAEEPPKKPEKAPEKAVEKPAAPAKAAVPAAEEPKGPEPMKAGSKTAPVPGAPPVGVGKAAVKPVVYKAGPDDPIMMFPSNVNLNFEGVMYRFTKGPNRVPKVMADHWYLRHCGAKEWKE